MSKNLRETIKLIEKLSLIKIKDYDLAERRLQHSINLANKLQEVDVSNVEPLYTVLEDHNLRLRKDQPLSYDSHEVFGNAQRVDHGYFVVDLAKKTKN